MAYLLAWILAVEVRQGTLGVDGRGWGPAGNTGRGYSRLRSGREHWAWMVVVEVRQGTLGTGRGWSWLRSGREHWAWMVVVEVRQGTLAVMVDGRGWGPAGNTGRGWSWLRSDRDHCGRGSRLSRRRRRGGGGGEEMRGEEEQATDIKSNNPHLAGGEKKTTTALAHNSPSKWRGQTLLRCMKSSFQHRLRRTMQWKIKYLLHLWNFWPGQWSPFIFFAARRWHWQFWDVSQHPYFPVLCLYTHSFSHIPMLHCNKPRWLPSFRPSKYLEGWDLSILSINQSINQPNLI